MGQVFHHENFYRDALDQGHNDIALVRLKEDVMLDEHTQAICLPEKLTEIEGEID